MGMTGDITPQLVEAQNTLHDLADGDAEPENQPQKAAAARHKPSLFVADAFTNPRHVQFAIKVTLAGMIGYLFYTASDYYGINDKSLIKTKRQSIILWKQRTLTAAKALIISEILRAITELQVLIT